MRSGASVRPNIRFAGDVRPVDVGAGPLTVAMRTALPAIVAASAEVDGDPAVLARARGEGLVTLTVSRSLATN